MFFEASSPLITFRMSRIAAQLDYFVPFQVSWGLEVSQLGQYKYPVRKLPEYWFAED